MTQFNARIASIARFGLWASRMGAVASVGMILSSGSQAQTFRSETLGQSMVIRVEAQASNPETVRLLVGLGRIKADLQLGMLFMGDGLTNPEGSHFSNPRTGAWLEIKDGLLAAGVQDFEPVLMKLEAGGGKDAVVAAFHEAETMVLKAHGTLNPSAEDMALTVRDLAKLAASEINNSGPTEVHAYQNAWAHLMVARGELDLLARSKDPAIAKLAVSEALAIDDVILSMPDPNQAAPVAFDPAPILELIGRLEKMDEAA